jgi:hypothetical protein
VQQIVTTGGDLLVRILRDDIFVWRELPFDDLRAEFRAADTVKTVKSGVFSNLIERSIFAVG